MRSERGGLLESPVLIGAVTVLVVIVAVALSYNANNGLPFVPSYAVKADLPDAASLMKGNEVRVGGKRVGTVQKIDAMRRPDGTTFARVEMKLDKVMEELPADSTLTVRPRSVLGLRYIELQPGRSRRGIPAEGTLPLAAAQPNVDMDEFMGAFDEPTRKGLQEVVGELGNGLAGRGGDLNRTFEALNPLLTHLTPVAANLAAPATDLGGFVGGLASAAGAVAPEAGRLGPLFDSAETTLRTLAGERDALGRILSEAPPTESTSTAALARIRPVLADTSALVTALRPGVRELPSASRRVADALETGTPVLRRTEPLADRLDRTLANAGSLVRRRSTGGAVRKLGETVTALQPTLRHVLPFQQRCNYLGLWSNHIPDLLSEGNSSGHWFRFTLILKPEELLQVPKPSGDLHSNAYGSTGQDGRCEVGNEAFQPGQRVGPAPTLATRNQATAPPPGTPKGPTAPPGGMPR